MHPDDAHPWISGHAGRTCPIPDSNCPPAHIAPVLGKRHRRQRQQAGKGEPEGECEILELGHDLNSLNEVKPLCRTVEHEPCHPQKTAVSRAFVRKSAAIVRPPACPHPDKDRTDADGIEQRWHGN
jgi:hypothetical protein